MDDGASPQDASRAARWSRAGLLLGAVLPFPAALLALSAPAAERLAPLLVPGAALLRPLSSAMAGWHGAVNVLLVSVVNGLLFAALAGGLALLLGRPRPGGPRAGRRTLATTALAALALLVVAAVAVSALAGRYADQAARDLRTVALDAGFDGAGDAAFSYPFLVERLGLVSRNEEPFPYGYATLDLELGGCRLDDVLASVTPDTRGWLPRRVQLQDVRFQFEHLEPATGEDPGAFRRVEFRTAAQLLDRLAETAPAGVAAQEHLCRLRSSDAQPGPVPAPARPAA